MLRSQYADQIRYFGFEHIFSQDWDRLTTDRIAELNNEFTTLSALLAEYAQIQNQSPQSLREEREQRAKLDAVEEKILCSNAERLWPCSNLTRTWPKSRQNRCPRAWKMSALFLGLSLPNRLSPTRASRRRFPKFPAIKRKSFNPIGQARR